MLEKSRVVQHSPGERNYHIFYYLFYGLTKSELEYYYLEEPENHRILYNNSNYDPYGRNLGFIDKNEIKKCKEMYQIQKDIMKRVGFTDEVIKN